MKMTNGSISCEVSAASDVIFVSYVPCNYDKNTVFYAARRFFARCGKLRRECTCESRRIRLDKRGKGKIPFCYLIPAVLMELPGEWARVTGVVSAEGVELQKVELFPNHPGMLLR
ncbi:MAG: hypothetical protein LUI13_08505 [Lachnospiraceae bacterium]|nr:hypothetical protein [Lachnospiraceae bacterium]